MKIFTVFLFTLLVSCAQTRPVLNIVEVIDFIDFMQSYEARVDTGAGGSVIHAEKLSVNLKEKLVRFYLRDGSGRLNGPFSSPIVALAKVRSSNGSSSTRPVIKTLVKLGGRKMVAEFSLYDRTQMTHKVLIGRNLLNKNFMVNPDNLQK